MNDEQTSGEGPSLDKSDPTNARLAALMVEQTGKVLQGISKLARLIGDTSPTPAEIANQIDDALREDAELEAPKFSDFGRFYLSQLVTEIRFPIGHAPPEADLEAEEPAGPVVDYIPVSWEEYGDRIMASLAKSAKKEREMTAMLDGVMAAGLFAATGKGAVAIALAKEFAAMIPDGEPMPLIPEGWAPVALAINPATGDFVTLFGPRSEPDGRVEAVETMVARLMQNSVAGAVSAVREAGRAQPKTTKEGWPMTKPRGPAQPRPTLSDVSPEKICEVCEEPTSVEVTKRRVAAGKVAYWPGVYLADGRFGHLECLREDESEE